MQKQRKLEERTSSFILNSLLYFIINVYCTVKCRLLYVVYTITMEYKDNIR